MRGFRTWISGPRFQALNARFQDLNLRTWVSGPRKLSILRLSYLFPVTFLCVHRHLSFSRHFFLCPSSLFSASSGHRQTDRSQTGWPASVGRNYTKAVCPGRFFSRKSVCPSVRSTVRAGSADGLKCETVVSQTHACSEFSGYLWPSDTVKSPGFWRGGWERQRDCVKSPSFWRGGRERQRDCEKSLRSCGFILRYGEHTRTK